MDDQVCIAGVGESKYAKRGKADASDLRLALEAIQAAAADAGISASSIDGLVTYSMGTVPVDVVASSLGMKHLRFASYSPAGGGGLAAVAMYAAMAVQSGAAEYVACYKAISQGSQRYGQPESGPYTAGLNSFLAPFWMLTPAQLLAPRVRRYMYETGASPEDFAQVSLASYAHAQRNPRAVMHGRPLTLQKYLNSRPIAEPFRLFDCCLETDGAAAFLVTTPERAGDLKNQPVRIASAVQGAGWRQEFGGPNASEYSTAGFAPIAPELFSRAGVGPREIDVLQVYDNFAPLVLMTLEDLGFCQRGEGPSFVRDGKLLWPDGEMPLNTSGGNLAEAYVHGFGLINEAVRQLRGESTAQVEGARHCLVAGGPASSIVSAMILGV